MKVRTHSGLLGVALLSAGIGTVTRASTIAQVETQTSGSTATINDSAVVSFVLDSGSSFNNSTFLVHDSTGNIEFFRVPTSVYTPVVGDAFTSISGKYSPFDGLQEVGSPFVTSGSITHGNAVPAAGTFTLNDLQDNSPTAPGIENTVGTLHTVYFADAGQTFNANGTYNVTDGTNDGVVARVFILNDSSDAALIGTTIPSGPQNVFGVVGQFDNGGSATTGYELDAVRVTAAPEPASLGLLTLGSLLALRRRAK